MKILVKRINRQVQVVRVGRRGLQGETGATGPQGPKGDQGDPATNLVQSVNGKQGVVVLNASDVNADPTGSAAQALSDAKDYTEAQVQDVQDNLDAHEADTANPHSVTKAQVGLGNVDNTSDANKPVSTATQTALDTKVDKANPGARSVYGVTSAGVQETVQISATANSTIPIRNASGQFDVGTPSAGPQAANKSYVDTADAAHIAAADPHPQYMNSDRGDARYAGQPYSVMAKSQSASLSSSYGTLGRIFGNDGYINDLQVYGLSTQAGTPTPDVPVPIVSTTGNVTVRSAAPSKNLFDGGVGITTGFYYDPFGTAVASAQDYIQTAYIPVLPNTTYTMSHSGSANPKAVQYTSGQTFISRSITVGGTSVTFTTTSNTAFVRLSSATSELATTQLELGPIATTYTPHNVSTQTLPLGTTQLRSLPNGVSDRIYKSGSSWFLEQNVDFRILNGTENWVDSGSGLPGYTRAVLNTGIAFKSRIAMNDRLTERGNGAHSTYEYRWSQDTNIGPIYVQVLTSRLAADTTAALKTWLAANNVMSLSDRKDPITTQITDPTLITALENIRTYQGVTNITASTPVSGSYGLDTTKALAEKVNKAGDTMTGNLTVPSLTNNGVNYITGTGFPNGVVTAPVGSIYIDKAITNGASSWIKKSGTGSTGWQVLEGDTGWRNVSSLLANGWTGGLYIRRTALGLSIHIEAASSSAATTGSIAILPSGFTPSTVSGIGLNRNFVSTATGPASMYQVTVNNGGSIIVQNFSTSMGTLYGTMYMSTADAYPTTLPGVSV